MTRVRHTKNGEFMGYFYTFDNGKVLYLQHTTLRAKKNDCWYFDSYTLRKCKELSCAIGVVIKQRLFWAIRIQDLTDSEFKVSRFKNGDKETGLPLCKFPVNPFITEKYIAKIITIKR